MKDRTSRHKICWIFTSRLVYYCQLIVL